MEFFFEKGETFFWGWFFDEEKVEIEIEKIVSIFFSYDFFFLVKGLTWF